MGFPEVLATGVKRGWSTKFLTCMMGKQVFKYFMFLFQLVVWVQVFLYAGGEDVFVEISCKCREREYESEEIWATGTKNYTERTREQWSKERLFVSFFSVNGMVNREGHAMLHGKDLVLPGLFGGRFCGNHCGKQLASEKNSGKKTKSRRYNKKIVGMAL